MAQLVPDDGLPLNTAARFTVRTAGAESNVAQALAQPGIPLVVKDGARAAVAFVRADEPVVVPTLPIVVREPVGAGNAFAAGWLYGRFHDLPCTARPRLGHLMAGLP